MGFEQLGRVTWQNTVAKVILAEIVRKCSNIVDMKIKNPA